MTDRHVPRVLVLSSCSVTGGVEEQTIFPPLSRNSFNSTPNIKLTCTDTNTDELYIFAAVLIYMGIHIEYCFASYWVIANG